MTNDEYDLPQAFKFFIGFLILVTIIFSITTDIPECWEDEIVVREVNLRGTYHCVAVDDLDHGYRP